MLSLQGCAGGLPGSSRLANSSSGAPGRDHPLASLSLGNESLVTSYMDLRTVDTPVHSAEGLTRWHQKGVHPYAFRVPSDLKEISWEDARQALQTPPLGIRSAVPLGGLGTGTLELRADGSLADWQIFNNSPGNGEKVQVEDAFFAIRTSSAGFDPHAFTIRTSPPDTLPAIEGLRYAGTFPVSRLQLIDSRLPLSVSLYAYGLIDMHNTGQSSTPAVVFSFLLANPTDEPVETAVMFNQPNILEGTYRTERGLVLSRSGDEGTAGELYLAFASNLSVTSMVSTDLAAIWKTFATKGQFENSNSLGLFDHGALASSFVIEPGASRTVSLVLSWRFPNRYIAGENVGNAYTHRYPSASQAGDEVIRQLPQIWQSLNAWNAITSGNTLPAPVRQSFANSLGQLYKTSFCTEDGRWRAWDSFSDAHISSLDANLYRALPLLFISPDIVKNLLRSYAVAQQADGQVPASFGYGQRYPLDKNPIQNNVRSAPAFLILAHIYLLYIGDEAFLKELWPHLLKALMWQLSITTPEGLPSNLPSLGDWTSIDQEGVYLQDAVLHLTGMQAMLNMAKLLELENVATSLAPMLATGLTALQSVFGSPNGYHHSTRSSLASADHEQDLLLGFIWDGLLNFDNLADAKPLNEFLGHIYDENTPAILYGSSKGMAINDAIAPAMAINWATLNLQAGNSASRSFDVMNRLFEHTEKELADNWGHYEKLALQDGLPLANPHHVSHLAIWFMVLAISGQRYDALQKKLIFNPSAGAGTRIPFFTPEAKGMLTVQRSERYLIEIIAGRLELERLEIGKKIVYRDILLEEGQVFQLRS